MPYITCNGKTWSRASSDPEAKQCITDTKREQEEAHTSCMASIECKAEYTHTQFVGQLIIGTGFTICLILLISIIYGLADFDDKEKRL